MMKFKVGDKVKIVKVLNSYDVEYKDDLYVNQEVEIIRIDVDDKYPYNIRFMNENFEGDNCFEWWAEEELELVDDSKVKARLEMFSELVCIINSLLNDLECAEEVIEYLKQDCLDGDFQERYKNEIATFNKAKELMGNERLL